MRTQFNVRIGKSLAQRVKQDKKNAGTNDIIAEVAFENWFTRYTPEQRAAFYRQHSRRPYGRQTSPLRGKREAAPAK